MNYHHDPALAAWVIHTVYCPAGQTTIPERIAQRMEIPIPDGETALEAIGQRILADPTDIPEFVAELNKLIGG